jgi:hypothetical protein
MILFFGFFICGCFLLLGWSMFALVFTAPWRSFGSWRALFGLGLWFLMSSLILFGADQAVSEGLEVVRKNNEWRHETTFIETSIVDRQEIYHECDGYEDSYSIYNLSLSLVPDQQAVCPGETVVIASVSRSVYEKYAHKQAARIYYFPADPLVFLIKGEI